MIKKKIIAVISILLLSSVSGLFLNMEMKESIPLENDLEFAVSVGNVVGRGGRGVGLTAYAEISPAIVGTNMKNMSFIYFIRPVIDPGDTGFDTVRIEIPGVYSNVTVSNIRVDDMLVAYTDNTESNLIEAVLAVKITTNGTVLQVSFAADTPEGVDWGLNFTSTLDDSANPDPLPCISGDGDGDGDVSTDTWTVRTNSPHGSFVQTHWSEGGYESKSGLVESLGPELRLASDPSKMVMLYDFDTDGAHRPFYQLWGMTEYRDQLYISVCKSAMESGNRGYVYAYNGTGLPVMVKELNEDGMWKIRTFDDKLYVPGHDTALGDKRGRVHIYDGTTKTWNWHYVTQFSADHNMDMEKYQNRLYISNCQINSQSGVWVSYDGGENWSQSYSYSQWGIDKLKAYNGNLYLGNSLYRYPDAAVVYKNKIVKYDGNSWQEKNIGNPRQEWDAIAGFGIYQDQLYLGAMESIFRYNDVTDTVTEVKHMDHVTYEFAEQDGEFFAVTGQVYRDDLIGDDNAFRKLFPVAPIYTDGINNAKLWSTRNGNDWQEVFAFDEDEALSVYSWLGRLYVGTGGDRAGSSPARLYAATYESNGSLVSRPYEIPSSQVEYGQLRFTRQMVTNTTVKFQFRTATTEAGLSAETFKGPAGTETDFYTASISDIPALHDNQRWFQYRVLLETENSTYYTPVLDSLIITYDANDVPFAENLKLSPTYPITIDDLHANYTYTDSETESGTEIRWYKNETQQPEYNDELVIPRNSTRKHEKWFFTVRPRDGIEFGKIQTSRSVFITNSIPTIDNLYIVPSTPKTEDNLTVVYTFADLDDDTENGSVIRWYRDGELQSSHNNRSVIPSNATYKGEEWWFSLRPSDGESFGMEIESSHVRINNTAPTKPTGLNPSLDMITLFENSEITANWSSSVDPDAGDVIYYTVYGELNNPDPATLIEAYSEDRSTILTGLSDNGTYYWRVEAFDGFTTAVSHVASFNVTINVQPTVLLLSPTNHKLVNRSSVSLLWEGRDANGDFPIHYDVYLGTMFTSVAWREPSALVSKSQESTIYNATFLLNETYYWSVIPNDGFVNGICYTGVWQFTVDVPPERVYNITMLVDVERLEIAHGEGAEFNITLTNNGNVLTTVKLISSGDMSSVIDVPRNVSIPVSELIKVLVTINDTSTLNPGDFELVIELSYPGGYETINIPVIITSSEPLVPIDNGDKDVDTNKETSASVFIYLLLGLVAIVVIGSLVFFFISRRRRKEKSDNLPEDLALPFEEVPIDDINAHLEMYTNMKSIRKGTDSAESGNLK